jgi:hypothetical protein
MVSERILLEQLKLWRLKCPLDPPTPFSKKEKKHSGYMESGNFFERPNITQSWTES